MVLIESVTPLRCVVEWERLGRQWEGVRGEGSVRYNCTTNNLDQSYTCREQEHFEKTELQPEARRVQVSAKTAESEGILTSVRTGAEERAQIEDEEAVDGSESLHHYALLTGLAPSHKSVAGSLQS